MSVAFVIAVAVLLGLALFLFNEMRRRTQYESGRPLRWRKRVRVVLASVPLILACMAFWAFFIEPNRLIVRQQTISISNWPKELDGFKVAVLSDIHVNGTWIDEEKLREIVERTNQLQPELIVILGDYIAYEGFMSGVSSVAVSPDARACVDGAGIVMICAPAFAHRRDRKSVV